MPDDDRSSPHRRELLAGQPSFVAETGFGCGRVRAVATGDDAVRVGAQQCADRRMTLWAWRALSTPAAGAR